MRVELEVDEARELLLLIVQKLAQEAELSEEDRAQLRRWFSEQMRTGSEAMKELTQKVNADLERIWRTKQRSAVRRPDWV
ncbi:MAG: hypothetical protein RQ985_06535 [Dehalococcoidia bacterium]|jgi:hypothetical protein|nr:hypothetical protein [Dehalococcoidia bacterium]